MCHEMSKMVGEEIIRLNFYIYLLQITYSTFANLLCKKILHIFSMIILWLLIFLFFFNIHVVINFLYSVKVGHFYLSCGRLL